MRAAGKKLKGSRGASIIIALGLVLICAMVSSVIVLAAATGSSRTVYRTEQQQKYLAISSAADLLLEEARLLGTYITTATMINHSCDDHAADVNYSVSNPCASDTEFGSYAVFTGLGGALADLVEAGCWDIADPNQLPPEAKTFSKTFTVESDDGRIPDVDCTFIMYYDYSIVIVLKNPDTEFALTVSIDAATNDNDSGNGVVTGNTLIGHCSHDVVKESIDPVTDEVIREEISGHPFDCEQSTKTLTITWSNISLRKGEDYRK